MRTGDALTRLIFLRLAVLPMWSEAVPSASLTYGWRLMGTLGLCEGGTPSVLRLGLGLEERAPPMVGRLAMLPPSCGAKCWHKFLFSTVQCIC